jgi:hypothetical protein
LFICPLSFEALFLLSEKNLRRLQSRIYQQLART